MWKRITSSTWSPWATGVILAFLFLIALYLLDEPLGSNAAYSMLLDKGREAVNGIVPTLDWQFMFLIGTFFGSFIASVAGKDFKLQLFPEDHLTKGPSFYLTLGPIYSFLGGVFVMSGLILAGNSFLKLWNDCLGLYMIIGLFLVIVFIEAVILGTMLTVKIEDTKE